MKKKNSPAGGRISPQRGQQHNNSATSIVPHPPHILQLLDQAERRMVSDPARYALHKAIRDSLVALQKAGPE